MQTHRAIHQTLSDRLINKGFHELEDDGWIPPPLKPELNETIPFDGFVAFVDHLIYYKLSFWG